MNDLPRIGPEPDCEYPGCRLLGRTRTDATYAHGWRHGMPVKIVCSIHAEWNGSDDYLRACPFCGRENNSVGGSSPEDRPVPGDVSICWGCFGVAFFTETGVRKPNEDEQDVLDLPEVKAAVAAMREAYTPQQAIELRRGGDDS